MRVIERGSKQRAGKRTRLAPGVKRELAFERGRGMSVSET